MKQDNYLIRVVDLVYDLTHDKEMNYVQIAKTLAKCATYLMQQYIKLTIGETIK